MVEDTLTLILAGGEGKRLHPLTVHMAKPLLPFGDGFRLLDFTLSNCVNSGLRRTYLLTQFDAESVERYVASGWGGVLCLPATSGRSYRGTADAILRNRRVIERISPKFVLVLCADHIYRMDYRRLLQFHWCRGAHVTVAAVEYPASLASDFGVIETNSDDRIVAFDEKPKTPMRMQAQPDRALVSMGIYVFNTELLLDETASSSLSRGVDFGKHVIPSMIPSYRVNAYNFTMRGDALGAYWRDVGTLDAYYRSHMEMVLRESPFDGRTDAEWPIYTAGKHATFHRDAVTDSVVADDCRTYGAQITRSLIGTQTCLEHDAEVEESIVMEGVRIGRSARVRRAIVEAGAEIPPGARIGVDFDESPTQYFVTPGGIVVIDSERRSEPPRLAIA